MYLLIVFFSLIGSCFAGLFGRYLGFYYAAQLTTSCLFVSFLISGIFIMFSLNKFLSFKDIKEFLLPITILFSSLEIFSLYTLIVNPYTAMVQIIVFLSIFFFNASMFRFFRNDSTGSFAFFVLNALTIFCYLRLASRSTLSFAFIYYFLIFFSFHLFKKTFSQKFFFRTFIILKGYYKEAQFLKIILWVFLILIPSLIKFPILFALVFNPVLIYLFILEYYFIFSIFSFIILWCIGLFLMNKYQIGLPFLYKCKLYFTRRACLHYIGW